MDHYTDTEFCPKENDFVDTGAVQDRVMAQAAPARRKRRLSVKLLAAAAAAVACIGMMAAGLPAQVYHMLTGGDVSVISDKDGVTHINVDLPTDESAPIKLEDGRLILTVDGQRIDVTDQIDENTPYIYTYTDPDTGAVSNLAVGGTVDDFGWVEWVDLNMNGAEVGSGQNYSTTYFTLDGVTYPSDELTEAQREQMFNSEVEWSMSFVERPWCCAAREVLGIEE